MDVMQWIDMYVDFRWMTVIANDGKVLGLIMPNNFHNMHHLKPVDVKCNKEYLDNFYVAHAKPHEVMKPWYRGEDDFKERVGFTKYSPHPLISLV